MDTTSSEGSGNQLRFQVNLGEENAWVEVVSSKNKIYAVDFPGKETLFITQIRDKSNKSCWVSIPQGNDELAGTIGEMISERVKVKRET